MTVFSILSFADQGVFDVVSNLGSLVARFLFRPIEDSSYLLFSQSITRGTSATQQDKVVITDWVLSLCVSTIDASGCDIVEFLAFMSSLFQHGFKWNDIGQTRRVMFTDAPLSLVYLTLPSAYQWMCDNNLHHCYCFLGNITSGVVHLLSAVRGYFIPNYYRQCVVCLGGPACSNGCTQQSPQAADYSRAHHSRVWIQLLPPRSSYLRGKLAQRRAWWDER